MASLAEKIRAEPQADAAELAKRLGCRTGWVHELRWRDRNREHFRSRQRQYYQRNFSKEKAALQDN